MNTGCVTDQFLVMANKLRDKNVTGLSVTARLAQKRKPQPGLGFYGGAVERLGGLFTRGREGTLLASFAVWIVQRAGHGHFGSLWPEEELAAKFVLHAIAHGKFHMIKRNVCWGTDAI